LVELPFVGFFLALMAGTLSAWTLANATTFSTVQSSNARSLDRPGAAVSGDDALASRDPRAEPAERIPIPPRHGGDSEAPVRELADELANLEAMLTR
jgi:hypothetical protein